MTAPNGRLRLASLVTVGAAAVCIILSCEKPEQILPNIPAPAQPHLGINECPHTWDIPGLKPTDPRTPARATITVPPAAPDSDLGTTNVPEYHDCQRLVDTTGAYGPLVSAFARLGLDTIGEQLRKLESGDGSEKALAVIELWNVDSTVYEPLKIDPGWSCLYVERTGETWRAKLVRRGWPEPDCRPAVDLTKETGQVLHVVRRPTTSTDFKPEDFPPVVRWEWDATHHHQYLGFKCDSVTWCEAGLEGFVPVAPLATNRPASRTVRRTLEIRAWVDEQQLAQTTPSGATPGPVRATVIPESGLRDRTFADFAKKWVQVGYVLMNGPSDAYRDKLNFVQTTAISMALSPLNTSTVSICWAGDGLCKGVPTGIACTPTKGPVGVGLWWAKFDAPGRAPIYKCVHYRAHPAAKAEPVETPGKNTLGTARWRWVSADETIWIGCPHGCCPSGGDT